MDRVLIADDSISMRKLLSCTLEDAGYRVMAAEDGVAAFAIAKEESANLVITDVNMPNMDGITLIGELRKLTHFEFTPILVLTTETDAAQKSLARSRGATGWLVKPIDPNRLLATIKKVLA